jgi:predicted Fe-Mo cluster-binding NifX family protein
MKIVLTTTAPELEAALDPRFGRGAYLLFIDTETDEWQAYPNPGASAPGGAGIKVTQFVVDLKAEAAISGDFGPNAFDALQASGVAMYLYGDCRSVQEVIDRITAGKLAQVGMPTADFHNGNRRRGG